jgi:hypothetical protein
MNFRPAHSNIVLKYSSQSLLEEAARVCDPIMGLPTGKGVFFRGHALTEHTTLHFHGVRGWGSHRTRLGDPPLQDVEGHIRHARSSASVP